MAAIQAYTYSGRTSVPERARVIHISPGTQLKDIERVVILETLKWQGFNRTRAARALGIGIRTLQRKLKKYGVPDIGLNNNNAQASANKVSTEFAS